MSGERAFDPREWVLGRQVRVRSEGPPSLAGRAGVIVSVSSTDIRRPTAPHAWPEVTVYFINPMGMRQVHSLDLDFIEQPDRDPGKP